MVNDAVVNSVDRAAKERIIFYKIIGVWIFQE